MNQKPPRVWISNASPKKGEVLRVRPRNIVTRFEAHLGTALLFAWEPGISISQNPYIEFTFLARESGELRLHWKDDTGQTASASKAISVG